MEYMKQEIKAGVLIVVSFIILTFLLFNVSGFKASAETNHFTVTFSNLNGLRENAPVMFAGVNVGKVEWINIKTDSETTVDVGISLKKTIPFKDDSPVMISSAGFVGEKYISISAGSADKQALKSGSAVRGLDPTDMVKLIERFDTVLSQLNVEELGRKLNKIADDVDAAISSVRAVTEDIRKSGKVQKVVNDTSDLIIKLRQFTDNVTVVVQENRPALKNSLANVEDLSVQLKKESNEVMAQLKDLIGDVDALIERNRDDLSDTIKNAKDFSIVVRREPWRLLWKENTDDYFKARGKKEESNNNKDKKAFPPFF